MFGDCKACQARDGHISDLRKQVENLSKLVYPKNSAADISLLSQEVDRVLSGSDEAINYSEAEIAKEEMDLLTGNYDNSQVEFEE